MPKPRKWPTRPSRATGAWPAHPTRTPQRPPFPSASRHNYTRPWGPTLISGRGLARRRPERCRALLLLLLIVRRTRVTRAARSVFSDRNRAVPFPVAPLNCIKAFSSCERAAPVRRPIVRMRAVIVTRNGPGFPRIRPGVAESATLKAEALISFFDLTSANVFNSDPRSVLIFTFESNFSLHMPLG